MSEINYEERSQGLTNAIGNALNQLREAGSLIELNDEKSQKLYEKIASIHDQLKSESRKVLGFE